MFLWLWERVFLCFEEEYLNLTQHCFVIRQRKKRKGANEVKLSGGCRVQVVLNGVTKETE